MNMGKRYQRGGRETRVSQFFSLTGRRDCVFLSLPNTRKRNFLPCTEGEGGRLRADFVLRFVSRHDGLDASLDDVFASEASSNCHPVDRTESFPLRLSTRDRSHFESFLKAFHVRKTMKLRMNCIYYTNNETVCELIEFSYVSMCRCYK